MWNGPNTLENIFNDIWGRPTTKKCPDCCAPLTICWTVKQLAKYVVVDFSRNTRDKSRRVAPALSFRTPNDKYSLIACGVDDIIYVRVDGDIDEGYGKYQNGVMLDVVGKVNVEHELAHAEKLNLLIYKKL
ncbi:hypothetical protein BNJ_00091 [Kaumoebavirus]|uniref:hypothetical protein n=1 Tax=Kaumoebavirus TaxID=1859492 RepID=UPI0009C1B6C8|nr:hypothetical protein BNJ_00091 [Kaumoebavirus]ARA71931.1 hypothetical protein BNJ_00091 [Kaumoebavirus]